MWSKNLSRGPFREERLDNPDLEGHIDVEHSKFHSTHILTAGRLVCVCVCVCVCVSLHDLHCGDIQCNTHQHCGDLEHCGDLHLVPTTFFAIL